MSFKTFAIAAAVALPALASLGSTADAGHRHRHFHHHHGARFLFVTPVHRDCWYYREMWEETGKFKWKRRYYECKGWW